MPGLFEPIRLGAVTARNRILMAPLTRARSTRDHVPTPMKVDYYRQRTGVGLIISNGPGSASEPARPQPADLVLRHHHARPRVHL